MAGDVAKALGLEREAVRAAGLRAGSVIVDLVFDSEAEDEEVRGVGASKVVGGASAHLKLCKKTCTWV